MNLIEKTLVRRVLKPRVTSDDPGECVLQLGALNLLPVDAGPHIHYISDALALLPWVRSSQTDKNGKITVQYDEARGSSDKLRRWLETAVEEAIKLTDTLDMRTAGEEAIVAGELERLKPLVSQYC
ncbi:MAG: hypothetical protein IJ174_03460 [Clostridia bacterium]|nr:hypothetical protein [Clostridia bacterium]